MRHRGPSRGLVAAAGLIAGITLLARLTGFARWLEFSRSVGATCVGTVYQTANLLPNVLFEVAAGGALSAVAVPLVAGAIGRGRRRDADRVASALLTWAVLLLGPAALLLWVLAGPVAGLFVTDATCPGARDLAAYLLRVFAPQVPLYGVGIVLAGVLQAHRRFLAAALAPLLSSLVVIATYAGYGYLARGDAIASVPPSATALLALGTTGGVALLSLPLLLPVRRAGIRLRPRLTFPRHSARRARSLALAGVLALAGQQYAVLMTIIVAGRGGAGLLNVYTYVQAVYLLPYAVLAVPLATAAFPALAVADGTASAADGTASAADEAASAATPTLARTLRVLLLLGALGAGVLAAASGPLGGFFGALDAGRGAATGQRVLDAMPSGILAFAPGLVGFSVSALLVRALYLRGQPRLAGGAIAAGWLIAGSVPLVLVDDASDPRQALVVLGLASSVGMTIAAADLLAAVSRSWGAPALAGLGRTAAVAVTGALLAGAAGVGIAARWQVAGLWPSVLQGLALGALALAVYAVVVGLGDRPAAQAALSRLRERQGSGVPG